MNLIRKLKKEHRKLWLEHLSPEVIERAKSAYPINNVEYQSMMLNSYAQEVLVPLVDDETLAYLLINTLANVSRVIRRPVATYDDALKLYAYEAVRRLLETAHGSVNEELLTRIKDFEATKIPE